MNSFRKLRVGDRVAHTVCGAGTITRIDWTTDSRARGVHVAFDKVGQKGEPWTGIYDEAWFRKYGLTKLAPQGDATSTVSAATKSPPAASE